MDIFNGNRRLEESVVSALDWGVFLRHDLDGAIAPFMHILDDSDKRINMLMTDGDPVQYAVRVITKENKPFQQFVIGMEGVLTLESGAKVDAIIVHGYDKTQPKGVVLAQMFEPKEKSGHFAKLGGATFLGNPDLPIPLETGLSVNYAMQEPAVNAIAIKKGELMQFNAFITHPSPSLIANTIKRYLRLKLKDTNAGNLSGHFEFHITPGHIQHESFLKFLVMNAIREERAAGLAMDWCNRTGRQMSFNVFHGDNEVLREFDDEGRVSSTPATSPVEEKKDTRYSEWTELQLRDEFYRLLSIPNGRTQIPVLQAMGELIEEHEKRGIPMPDGRTPPPSSTTKKPWWKIW